MSNSIVCPYALGGINYKNGFVTSCPQQSDELYIIEDSVKPSDIINSPGFLKHRKEMMSGTWSQGCHLCKEAEEIGSQSMRHDFDHVLDRVVDLNLYDSDTGEIDFASLRHVEIRFSNSCNMACLHCSDVYSSGWMTKLKHYEADEEDRKHKLIQLTREFHKTDKNMNLSISISIEQMEELVSDLNKNFPNIMKIDFAGGEVLYQKQFFPCLELLAQHPNAANIRLAFHSNFNAKFDPVKLSKLLEPFDRSIIHMSLDAGKNIYGYFRTGDWDKLTENVRVFREIDKKSELNIVCTTSAYQIMDIENIFESFMELDVNFIDCSIVYTPRYMNPSLMALYFADEVKADIQKAKDVVERERQKRFANLDQHTYRRSWNPRKREFTDLRTALEGLNEVEHYVFNNHVSQAQWEAFMVYIRKTDKIWQQKFNEHMVNYKFNGTNIERIEHV